MSNKPRRQITPKRTDAPRHFLLVDAHNVIFARPDLAVLHRRNPAAARERLVRILERHQDTSYARVVVVFDGGTAPKASSELSGAAGVQVIYPRSGQSADAIIEQLVVKYASVHRLTVATGDSLIRTAAVASGASTIPPEALFDDIARAEKDLADALGRLRRR